MKIFSHPALYQIIKFCIIGTMAFVIDNSLFCLLCHINSHLAIAVGFVAALLFNYYFSTKWVFDSKRKQGVGVLVIFSVLSFIGFLLTELLFTLFLSVFLNNPNVGSYETELAAKLVSTFIVMIYNFITRKIFLER